MRTWRETRKTWRRGSAFRSARGIPSPRAPTGDIDDGCSETSVTDHRPARLGGSHRLRSAKSTPKFSGTNTLSPATGGRSAAEKQSGDNRLRCARVARSKAYQRGRNTWRPDALQQYSARGTLSHMGKSDEYRRFARECLEIAETMDDSQTRAVMVQMAQVWFRLAAEHAPSLESEAEG
jgi:hypothetical protein